MNLSIGQAGTSLSFSLRQSHSLDPGYNAVTMSSAVSVLPSAAPAKSPKKRGKSQRKKTGPTVSDLILKAASASSERGGVSLAALKEALKAAGYDVVKNKARILTAIKRLVASKSLVQTKHRGFGSFKLNKNPPTPRKKAVKKKPKAKRVKRASPKKAVGGATPAAKKSPKKKRKSKSPAKRPAAAKKPRSPKKAKRRIAKSTRTRAAAKK
ncbi:LOW QUALITY PROTEIN: protamine-like protein [Anarhichas minor]|uniref:LOW QUALITY PROTEIN: protamine-like protein n=1 Tax=Anarhichas minor TaxID=65739 RepID=UPI003F73E49A